MTPTAKLRFVQRKEENWPIDCQYPTIRNVKILQQWYAYDIEYPTTKGEWRDVPLEKEECCGNPFKCMGNCHG